MDFSENVKGFLMQPSKTFDATKEDHFVETLIYYMILAMIFSIMSVSIFTIASNSIWLEYPLFKFRIGIF